MLLKRSSLDQMDIPFPARPMDMERVGMVEAQYDHVAALRAERAPNWVWLVRLSEVACSQPAGSRGGPLSAGQKRDGQTHRVFSFECLQHT
jgi:hypothetical protein